MSAASGERSLALGVDNDETYAISCRFNDAQTHTHIDKETVKINARRLTDTDIHTLTHMKVA